MNNHTLFSHFFYPETIVVVGVSPDKANLARNIVMNSLLFGFQGQILSVGLKGGVVFGQRIYRSLEEIDGQIHLAVILTPAKSIPEVLKQCGEKGIQWAVIESGGFSEMGEEGRFVENACMEMARRYGIRFIGPNGIGTINMEIGLVLPFLPLQRDISLGPVSILTQSGGVGLSYLTFLAEENIGLNKFVSMGNKLNVDENDLLDYLIHDAGTKIILLYLEGFTDGRRFMEIASKSEKPVLVHKSNRFKASAQIAHSHTTALFGDDKLVDFALEQAGCVRVNTLDDAMDYLKSLTLPPLKGNRLAVVSRSGGHAVIASDACAHYGFQLPSFPKDFLRKIENRLRAHVIRLQNPLDLGDLFDLDFYEFIVEQLLEREDVDGVLLGHAYRHRGYEQEASRNLVLKVSHLMERYQKPVALFILTESEEMHYLRKHSTIPIFSAPENAMRAFHLSHTWASRRPIPMVPQTIPGIDKEKAKSILSDARERGSLLLKDALELIHLYGFQVPAFRTVSSPHEAVEVWRAWNGPVALKINRPHISHKTDLGAVLLHLDTEKDLREAFKQLQTRAGTDQVEVLIQSMAEAGLEVILGGRQDRLFGPAILFGLGGVFVETLEDVSWRIAPICGEEALRMIRQIRGNRLLDGIRGDKAYDIHAIQGLLVKLSQMLADLPEIQEIDINPVMVFHEGTLAVDARVLLKNPDR